MMQTINRNNYEEYFLLHIDGELDVTMQQAVEDFVQQNTDLAVELEMLLNTRLAPEAIEFDNKESLLRTEGNNINEHNHEEYFLLYIDNELSETKRREVEMYVLQHPALQEEFTTLKQAVLAPEVISYGNKEGLYRTEKRRVIYLKPLYWAAAAVFIGLCGVGLWMFQQPANNTPVAVRNPVEQQKSAPANIPSKQHAVDSSVNNKAQPLVAAQQTNPAKENKPTTHETAVVKKKKETTVNVKNENNIAGVAHDNVQPEQNTIAHNNIIKQQQIQPDPNDLITDMPKAVNNNKQDIAAVQKQADKDVNTLANNYKIYNVAYKEINTNDEDRSLRVGMLDLNKDKVKGFLKKAGRIFGKSNNNANDDGKLQVANFEIDTKKQ